MDAAPADIEKRSGSERGSRAGGKAGEGVSGGTRRRVDIADVDEARQDQIADPHHQIRDFVNCRCDTDPDQAFALPVAKWWRQRREPAAPQLIAKRNDAGQAVHEPVSVDPMGAVAEHEQRTIDRRRLAGDIPPEMRPSVQAGSCRAGPATAGGPIGSPRPFP